MKDPFPVFIGISFTFDLSFLPHRDASIHCQNLAGYVFGLV